MSGVPILKPSRKAPIMMCLQHCAAVWYNSVDDDEGGQQWVRQRRFVEHMTFL